MSPLLAAAALAGPLAVEPSRAWEGTRFLLLSEQRVPVELALPGHDGVYAEALQLALVLDCHTTGRRRAACAIEDAAIRAATRDLWQRPADRARVDALLGAIRAELTGTSLVVRFDRRGDLRAADLAGVGAEGHVLDVVDLAAAAFAGVGAPPPDGEVWARASHPLLRLAEGAWQCGEVVHFGGMFDGRYVVQTTATADSRDATLRMQALSAYDPESGHLEQRLFEVGAGPPVRSHLGGVRRLASGERPALGPTAQVASPAESRPQVAPWVPILEEKP